MGDSIGTTLAAAAERLRAAGIPTPELDAQLLLACALGRSRAAILAERRALLGAAGAAGAALARFHVLLERRCRREPLAYLVGEREFWSLPLVVDARVLVPRPETETVVERSLDLLRTLPPGRRRVVDVGTGSGAIALAIASEVDASVEVLALDRSHGAIAVARENARRLAGRHRARLDCACADLLAPIASGSVDLVVSNPPYLSEEELARAEPELSFEPAAALLGGGDDGLDLVRRLLDESARVLRRDGAVAIEVGAAQGPAALRAALAAGFDRAEIARDLESRDRVLVARRGECRVGAGSAGGAA